MQDLLITWAKNVSLENEAISVRVHGVEQKSSSVDLDSDAFIGTVTHWAPNIFEFQFNSASTGEVLLLETVELNSLEEIDSYFRRVMQVIGET